LPEAVVAVPAALLVIATGAISAHDALEQSRRLGPVIGFLAAVLVLAQLCDDDGLFRACGAWLARAAAGRPQRLLALVFAVAAVTTAVLSLDATVVLLTPVVFATAARLEARARPHLYACTHLSNSGSLLLPVSNLTNLLAFAASGLSFGRFAGLMHVTPAELSDAAHGAYLGLFGRGRPDRDPGPHVAKLAAQSAADLLAAAAARLGRPAGSSAAASPSGKWSPRWPTRPCSSWPGTATAPAWAPRAWERRPASSSTTRPARFWSSGRKPPRR
jgi:arsenical pump membrane protein